MSSNLQFEVIIINNPTLVKIFMKVHILAMLLLIVGVYTAEIDYTETVQKLQDAINNNADFHHKAYEHLAYISDTFGPRMWGSDALEKVILEVYKMAKTEGFDNIRLEAVKNFTKWVRGNEQLILHSPRPVSTPLKVIGLGLSVAGHVKANALVVRSFDDLEAKKDLVKGKIVVFNTQWKSYGETVDYRVNGAWHAAKYGAVAALVRSVTPRSIQSVHAGVQHYSNDYPKIPVAAITLEDAEMLDRMQARNQQIVLELTLQNTFVPNTYSNNVVFQIKGSTKPEEIILMGGHIDSWDTGSQTGANDDGGGFITCFDAMRLILKNGLRPKRTIRFIAWSGEEYGGALSGGHAYLLAHREQLKNHIVAFQDDLGSTKFLGVGYSGSDAGRAIVKAVADQYMGAIGKAVGDDGEAVDTGPLLQIGIPSMNNMIQDDEKHTYYFTYHHSAGDSMTMMNADDLDSNVLGVACMFYILADLDVSIPLPDIKQDKLDEYINKIHQARMSGQQ